MLWLREKSNTSQTNGTVMKYDFCKLANAVLISCQFAVTSESSFEVKCAGEGGGGAVDLINEPNKDLDLKIRYHRKSHFSQLAPN